MATGHQDGGVRVWDVSTGEKINFMPKVHSLHVLCIQYHPRDGHIMLASSRDSSSIKLIDCRTYEEIKNLRMPTGKKLGSTRVSFSPDGTMVAAGTADGGIVVWNVGTGSVQCSLAGDSNGGHSSALGISCVDWSVAGLLSADKSGCVIQWRS
jgi:autophagy-related protein 16